ncbi:MAG: RNA-binding protein, partial [Deltaproteobacteria bacterium]
MSTTVKIRSVYATALTKFLLDRAYKIVGPSIEIQERFGLLDSGSKADILI